MRTISKFNYLTILILLCICINSYASYDIIQQISFSSALTTGDSESFDLDIDGVPGPDITCTFAVSRGILEIVGTTPNQKLRFSCDGDCDAGVENSFTIQLHNSSVPSPLSFVNLLIDRTNAGASTIEVEGVNPDSDPPIPFSKTAFNIIANIARYQFVDENVSSVEVNFTPAVLGHYIIIEQLLLNDNTKRAIVNTFDRSGSMILPYGASSTRIAEAKESLIQFTTLLMAFSSDIDYGMIAFPEQPYAPGICSTEEIAALQAVDNFNGLATGKSPLDSLTELINDQNAESITPLIIGMNNSVGMFGIQPFQSIVLLSDGYNNCPDVVDITNIQVTSLIESLNNNNINAYTIGFGSVSDPHLNLLSEIADETGGKFFDETYTFDPDPAPGVVSRSVENLAIAYGKIIKEGLGLETSADPTVRIMAGETKSHHVSVNKLDKKICFYISHANSNIDNLNIQLLSSDSVLVSDSMPGISIIKHTHSTFITADKKFLSLPGKVDNHKWQLNISTANTNNKFEEYQYMVLCESDLRLNTWLNKKSFVTGDTLTIYLRVTNRNEIITNLDSVFIQSNIPADGLGNWLANNKVTADDIQNYKQRKTTDSLNFAQKKADILVNRKIKFPAKLTYNNLTFNDKGTDGDLTAGDGIYTCTYGILKKEGTHIFTVKAGGKFDNTPGGEFVRETQIQKYVNVKPKVDNFVRKVRLLKKSSHLVLNKKYSLSDNNKSKNIYNITLNLIDKYGNIPHPSALRKIKLSINKGELLGTILPQPDGTYIQQIIASTDTRIDDIQLTMTIGDESGSESLKQPIPKLRLVLIALIILIIIWLIKRPKN